MCHLHFKTAFEKMGPYFKALVHPSDQYLKTETSTNTEWHILVACTKICLIDDNPQMLRQINYLKRNSFLNKK